MFIHLVRLVSRTRVCVSLLVVAAVTLAAARPASAQIDLSGSWAARNFEDVMERIPGPYAVDYTGLPINDDARARALSYSASQMGMIERQCALYASPYIGLGPFGLKIWNETDPTSGVTVAWHIGAWEDRAGITIWMDGRPHPGPNAPHDRSGFTTGEWQGDTLATYTTHLGVGVVRRNGVPSSDQATMKMFFFRNGDHLTLLVVVEDPVYLTEAFMVSQNFELDPSAPIRPIGPPCVPAYEGQSPDSPVLHYLPGANPFIGELTQLYHIPPEATLGGAQTMYPEFRKRMKDGYVRPEKCVRNCGGPGRP